ncbi:hypothetical protein MNBD_PLANCTO02-2541 [hydrothermal vent metagenome]|uniref:Outer membrane efflux protein n=1 Tax=hydrothermal vent metagenome TaxID=652676 RepID=A0A3B1DUB8_9ZZZZ
MLSCCKIYARLLVFFGVIAMLFTGCSRTFWREHADKDTYNAMADKFTDPRWNLPRVDVRADPRSRFYDGNDLDYAPLPPDDEAAHAYMYEMNGARGWRNLHKPKIRGWRGWHKFGQNFSVENPHWLASFGLKPEQLNQENKSLQPIEPAEASVESTNSEISLIAYEDNEDNIKEATDIVEERLVPTIEKMTLPQALELANINNRDYQTQIENLYLSALALTFDRFQFGVRFLGVGGARPSVNSTFQSAPPGVNDRLQTNSRFGLGQLLPTGAQWAIEIANDTIWLFQGQGRSTTASLLSYRLTQPLLLGAGRKVVLEGLTQQERDVLYQTRILARFRKTLFTDIVSGGSGYLGLIEQSQTIDNQKRNIFRLVQQLNVLREVASQSPENITETLEKLPPGFSIPKSLTEKLKYNSDLKLLIWNGELTKENGQQLLSLSREKNFQNAANEIIQRKKSKTVTLDVAVLESQLARSQNALKQSKRRLQDTLDAFKIQLGLPPDFQISIDESMLTQFQLIDPQLSKTEQELIDYVKIWAELDEQSEMAFIQRVIDGLSQLEKRIQKYGIEGIEADMIKVDQMIKSESTNKNSVRDLKRLLEDVARDKRLFRNIKTRQLAEAKEERKSLLQVVAAKKMNADEKRKVIRRIAELRETLLKITQSLQVIQIGQRVESVSLESFQMPLKAATSQGVHNRLDLMNSKAAVMDVRRRVEITANQLEAILDLKVEGDIRTPTGTRPFEFRSDQSSYRAGISFTAPLDQVLQRNNYRSALLDYQRARRTYMAAEDNVKLSIRQNWRQLRVLRENFEIARQAIRIAALQFDQAVEQTRNPKNANQGGNQGLNLLNALGSVLDAQNDFIGIWVNYERSRLNIHRDMGMMEIDSRGIWTDSYYLKIAGDSVEGDNTRLLSPSAKAPHLLPPPAPAAPAH